MWFIKFIVYINSILCMSYVFHGDYHSSTLFVASLKSQVHEHTENFQNRRITYINGKHDS